MAKFAIECPRCGKYAEGKKFLIWKTKEIECACGNIIEVKTDKLASRECPNCGNSIVFNQTKGDKALCPICHSEVNTLAQQQKTKVFSCAQCGVRLMSSESAETYTCPVCDFVNNVKERMMAEKIQHDGLASIIKYEGDNSTFVWKHPIEDFNYGSQLIVHETQEAIFFKDGQALDLFGPGRYTLETQKLPLMEKIYQLPTDTEGTFHSEVYYINKTVQMAIKWGTPEKVRFIDPLTGVPLELGASGEMNLMVSDSRKLLLKLVGTMKGIAWGDGKGFTKSLQDSFRPLISSAVKTNLSNVIKDESIDILDIDSKLDIISGSLQKKISAGFEEYGLTIPQFYVTSIVLPDEREYPDFKTIKELHRTALLTRVAQEKAIRETAQIMADTTVKTAQINAETTVKTAKAESEKQYRTAEEQSAAAIEAAHREAELQRQLTETEIAKHEAERTVIEAEAAAKAKRMDGLTDAEIMRAMGYTQKDVIQADVQKAYAESIGNMGPAMTSGGSSGIVGDMLGLGVGLAAAGAIAPQLGEMIHGINIPNSQNGNQNVAQNQSIPYINPINGASDKWDCKCGAKGVVGKFCNNCGSPRPSDNPDTWDCVCGNKGVIGNFCNNCGAKRPAKATGWDCICGNKGIIGNFCNNCGAKKPEEPEIWDCDCGQKGIIGNFCTNCGKKRGE